MYRTHSSFAENSSLDRIPTWSFSVWDFKVFQKLNILQKRKFKLLIFHSILRYSEGTTNYCLHQQTGNSSKRHGERVLQLGGLKTESI